MRWVTGLIVTVSLLVVFAPTTVGGATSYVIVSGSSMSPTLADGDLVVVRQGEYEVGDIVAFQTGGGLVIHRIVGGSAEQGFVMQGDNKSAPDTWTPLPDEIVGKSFAQVPEAGRWVLGLSSNPALLGAMIGGLGSLLIWSPHRRRRRHGAHSAETPRQRTHTLNGAVPVRGAGPTLMVLAITTLLLAGAATWLMLRPLERVETVDRVLFEHQGEFSYTAAVEDSVVYDSDTVSSPGSGSEPTAIYTQLVEELLVDFEYSLASPAAEGTLGTVAAELRIGAGEGLWTRTVPLLPPDEFQGSSTSASFPVDVDRVLGMVARAEEETGFNPGLYQLTVATVVRLQSGSSDPTVEVFTAELPMELRGALLSIVNEELALTETTAEPEKTTVPNDIEVLGLTIPTRWARASVGALLTVVLLVAIIYGIGVRRRLGPGEVGRIQLRYGSLIVPVTGPAPNGDHPVDVGSISDLVRLARRAEQMVFHEQTSPTSHRFFVPDGPVTYRYEPSTVERDTN